MIPALNLNRLRRHVDDEDDTHGSPPPSGGEPLGSFNRTLPPGALENTGSHATFPDSYRSHDGALYTPTGGLGDGLSPRRHSDDAGSGATPVAIAAASFMGFDPNECDDVATLREKLVAAQGLFRGLERRYEDELMRKERRLAEQLERLVGGGGAIWNPYLSPVGVSRSSGSRGGASMGVSHKGVQVGGVGVPLLLTPVGSARSAAASGMTPRSGRDLASGRSIGGNSSLSSAIHETNSTRLRRQMLANRTDIGAPLTSGAGPGGVATTSVVFGSSRTTAAAHTARSPGPSHRFGGSGLSSGGYQPDAHAVTARGAVPSLAFGFGRPLTGTAASPTPTSMLGAGGSTTTPRTAVTPRPYTPAQRRTAGAAGGGGAITPRAGGAVTPRR